MRNWSRENQGVEGGDAPKAVGSGFGKRIKATKPLCYMVA